MAWSSQPKLQPPKSLKALYILSLLLDFNQENPILVSRNLIMLLDAKKVAQLGLRGVQDATLRESTCY